MTVVGIGASAGGLEACIQFLTGLPPDTGMAFVLVQHLAPTHPSVLPDLLAGVTSMTVSQAVDGMELLPDQFYVTPPNVHMYLVGRRLKLIPRPEDRTQHNPIDFFFRSLAEQVQERAVGIILSGTASDGAAGLRDIKAVGGITLAQHPKSAKYDGMPRAAIATGVVDLVLPAGKMGSELVSLARHPLVRQPEAHRTGDKPGVLDLQLRKIYTLLKTVTGVDFSHYKQPTVRRRLQRRMVLQKVSRMEDYIDLLRRNPAEVHNLYQDILIHVTSFFREPESFKVLASSVFPKLVESRAPDAAIRVWIPGCSTGEEAYSVVISLLEFLGDEGPSFPIQVFGTDLSENAIEHARAGVYQASIAGDVGPERLGKYFTKIDSGYKVIKTVRDHCIFARQDITRDPPFPKVDLILCRNVLIYLDTVLQKSLLNNFHYAMKLTGYLMLGSAESTGPHADLFSLVDKRYKLYTKKAVVSRPAMTFSPHPPLSSKREEPPPGSKQDGDLQGEANRIILSRFGPPGVVIDGDFQIIHFRGQTGPYLEPAPGDASLNLLKMAREGLLYGLRSALNEVRRSNKPVRKVDLQVKSNGQIHHVDLEVIPLPLSYDRRHYLVLFQARESAPEEPAEPLKAEKKRKARPVSHDESILRLEQELAANREYLQSIIQDLEAANEELQSANEEILSSNEELQSTNEELDTAKEELQSTNEEINTVNEELQSRNEELSRVNGDLVNLLSSVQIAIVMVASDLRIRRFTPMAEKLLNLIPTDIGRPISDIKSNLNCPELEKLITESIDTVSMKEREVQDADRNWYSLRIRPYKNLENRIDGAIVSLFEIEAAQESGQVSARELAEATLEAVHEPLALIDLDGPVVKTVNRSFREVFGGGDGDTRSTEITRPPWDRPSIRHLLEEVLPGDGRADGVPLTLGDGPDRRSFRVKARGVGPGKTRRFLLAFHEEPQDGN